MPAEIGVRQATAEEERLLLALLQCKPSAHSADLQFVLGIYSGARQGLDIMTTGREAYLGTVPGGIATGCRRNFNP
jgi:hypothetical protein